MDSWGSRGSAPGMLKGRSNVSLFATELGASTDRGLSGLTTCSRKLGDPWVNHKNRNLLHPCGMKNENNFIRESHTQPGNSYQCEHREPRGANFPVRAQRGAHRLCLPGALASLFHRSPVGKVGTLKEAAEYHAHGAQGHARAEAKLCLRRHSGHFFPVCCAKGRPISSKAPSTRKGSGPHVSWGHLFCSLLMGIYRDAQRSSCHVEKS